MSQLRFNHVFAGLMAVSFISAFLVPPRVTNPARGEFTGLFSPISHPVRSIAGLIYNRFHPEVAVDYSSPLAPRPTQTILEDNLRLNSALAALSIKFEALSQVNKDRALVGDILPLCRPATVTGSDASGLHESLLVSSPSLNEFKADMPVVYTNNLVGKVMTAGLVSAHLRLITDPGFILTGRIGQCRPNAAGVVEFNWTACPELLLQGVGRRTLAVRSNVPMQRDMPVHLNDMVYLYDHDWPANVQGCLVGRVIAIDPQPKAPLLADIRVEPVIDLPRLKEVMVMVKE